MKTKALQSLRVGLPEDPEVAKLSWKDTAREMAEGREDWTAWDVVDDDGLSAIDFLLKTRQPRFAE